MIGFAMTGSFCSFEKALKVLEELTKTDEVLPILSDNARTLDTKFGEAAVHYRRIVSLCGREPVSSIPDAEPIGPKTALSALVICPCTGNTLGKLAGGICDTPVTMAAKAHLRNERPLVIALATNDGLAGSAVSIGKLLQRRNIYFVPFGQDAPGSKPRSLVCDFSRVPETLALAKEGKQIQPILL